MSPIERTWYSYAIAASILHDLVLELDDRGWEPRLNLDETPSLEVGTWIGTTLSVYYTISVDQENSYLTFRVTLTDGTALNLALLIDPDPDPKHVEALKSQLLSVFDWDVADAINTLLNTTGPALTRDWGKIHAPEHDWEYTGALDNGTAVTLLLDERPAALSVTLEIGSGKDAQQHELLVNHDTDLTEASETLLAYLKGEPNPLIDKLRRLVQDALPDNWALTPTGASTWGIGPADGELDPYELDLSEDEGDVYVLLSYWSEEGSPCDCCDEWPGFNPLFGYSVSADDLDGAVKDILAEIRSTHDI